MQVAKVLLFIILILNNHTIHTQNEEQILRAIEIQKLGYKFREEILMHELNEKACFELCSIGKDKEAKKYFENIYPSPIIQKISKYHVVSAQSYIYDYIKREQPILVAINEAHHVSQHRMVMQLLLPYFFENGYRHLAVEGLSFDDDKINDRKYPKFIISGYYLKDPEYGNMVRKALELGFTLIPYDQKGPDREEKSADVLCDYIFVNKVDKLIIYAGFDHIRERMPAGKKSLVMYLNDYLQTNAFTVSQTEHLSGPFKHEPSICENYYMLSTQKGQIYNGANKDVDLAIFYNFSDLLSKNIFPDHIEYKPSNFFQNFKYPSQIRISIKKEGLLAIPVAVKEIKDYYEFHNTRFFLEKGKEYEIKFFNDLNGVFLNKTIKL